MNRLTNQQEQTWDIHQAVQISSSTYWIFICVHGELCSRIMWFKLWIFRLCYGGSSCVRSTEHWSASTNKGNRRRAACIALSEMLMVWPRPGLGSGPRLQLSGPPFSCNTCCLCKFTIKRTPSLPLVNDTRSPPAVCHICLTPWWLQMVLKQQEDRTSTCMLSHILQLPYES